MSEKHPIEWTFSYYDGNGIKHTTKGLVDKQELILEFLKDLNECVNMKQYNRLKEKWEKKLNE